MTVKNETPSHVARWSTDQTSTSANGGHFTIDVVTYGFAPWRSWCATCIQLSGSSECADSGHTAISSPRTSHAEPSTRNRSIAAGGKNLLHRAPAADAECMRGI